MTIKNFEKGCVAYYEGKKMMDRAEKVLDILLETETRMRAKEIAHIMYGCEDKYAICNVTWSLRHLIDCGLVNREKVKGEPFEITDEEYVEVKPPIYEERTDECGITRTFIVERATYEWKEITKTITPKISYFSIVK